jgi:hypothetical protein
LPLYTSFRVERLASDFGPSGALLAEGHADPAARPERLVELDTP